MPLGLRFQLTFQPRRQLLPLLQEGASFAQLVAAALALGLSVGSATVSASPASSGAGLARGSASVLAAPAISAVGATTENSSEAVATAQFEVLGLIEHEIEVIAQPEIVAGGDVPPSYESNVLALGPAGYWRLNHAAGQVAPATVGNAGTYNGTPEIPLVSLVENTEVGACSGIDEDHWISLTSPITSANFTIDCALQVDRHKSKHVIITTGGGSVSGQFSLELVDDGAGGLQARVWSRPPNASSLHVLRTPAGSIPIGTAFKLSYRRDANGTQSVLINGVEQTLTTELGSPGISWDPPPAGTVYVGRWSSGVDPLDGVMAELAIWNTPVSTANLLSLAQAKSIVWLPEAIDAGQVDASASKVIDFTDLVHPVAGVTLSNVTPNPTRGNRSINGLNVTYAAGAVAGNDDIFGVRASRSGINSQTCVVTIDVEPVDANVGENPNLPFFGRYYGCYHWAVGAGDTHLDDSNTHGTALFFWAEKSGQISHWRQQLRWQGSPASGYSAGDLGIYTVEIREANPNTFLPNTSAPVICSRSGWNPRVLYNLNPDAVNGVDPIQHFTEVEFTTKGSVVAKGAYCLIVRNTHADPANNYLGMNTDLVRQSSPRYTRPSGFSEDVFSPARIHLPNGQVKPWLPAPVVSDSSGRHYTRCGAPLFGIRYSDGTWCGWDSYGSNYRNTGWLTVLTTTTHLRERFQVTRASREVDRLYLHVYRKNAQATGTLTVTIEDWDSENPDTTGNGNVLRTLTRAVSALPDVGAEIHHDDVPSPVWQEFTISPTLTLQQGRFYAVRLRTDLTNSNCEVKFSARAEQQGLGSISSSWTEYMQIRKCGWTSFDDSRGLQTSSNSGSTWSRTAKTFGCLFRCVI